LYIGQPGPFVHRQLCDIAALEHDRTAVWRNHAHDHPKGRGLAGSIAAEQSDNAAPLDRNGYPVDNGPAGVPFLQLASFKKSSSAREFQEE